MSFVGNIGQLADTTVLLLLLVFVSTNIACLVLKRDRVDHDHFTVPRIVPVLALVASIVLITQQTLDIWLFAGAYLVVGVVLFAIARLSRRRAAQRVDST